MCKMFFLSNSAAVFKWSLQQHSEKITTSYHWSAIFKSGPAGDLWCFGGNLSPVGTVLVNPALGDSFEHFCCVCFFVFSGVAIKWMLFLTYNKIMRLFENTFLCVRVCFQYVNVGLTTWYSAGAVFFFARRGQCRAVWRYPFVSLVFTPAGVGNSFFLGTSKELKVLINCLPY